MIRPDGVIILDKKLKPVPKGVVGFVCLRFDVRPDSIQVDDMVSVQDGFIFNTGDKGRVSVRGIFELLETDPKGFYFNDTFVFSRDIELMLLGIPGIKECKVLNQQLSSGQGYIPVAHVVVDTYVDPSEVRDVLSVHLPDELVSRIQLNYLPSLPVDEQGNVSVVELTKIRIVGDGEVIGVEALLKEVNGIGNAVGIVKDDIVSVPRLHVSDLVPGMKTAGTAATSIARLDTEEAPTVVASGGTRVIAWSKGDSLITHANDPQTLAASLRRTVECLPDKGIVIIGHDLSEQFLSYKELLQQAKHFLHGMLANGFKPRGYVILQIDDPKDHLTMFWACVLGGIIPLTVAVPPQYNNENSVTRKLFNVWKLLQYPPIITVPGYVAAIRSLSLFSDEHSADVFSTDDLRPDVASEFIYDAAPEDVVFLQLSSGSTGIPKCIQETHQGIIHHIQASVQYNRISSDDVSLNWLPFDHVVPMILFHLRDVYMGIQQVQIRTQQILANPLLWLDYIERHRVTITWSPNFGYKLLADRAEESGRVWDLSSVRYFMNAGEQVTYPIVKRFLDVIKPFGVREKAMKPAYGMAEVCTAVVYNNTFSPEASVLWLGSSGQLQTGGDSGQAGASFVENGGPIPGSEIRIVDHDNELLFEGMVGKIQVRTISRTPGYLYNEKANEEALLADGWYETGDLGALVNGRLTITGREKEMIIIRGIHYYCFDIEDFVGQLKEIEPTFVAACSIRDAVTGVEGLAVFFTPKDTDIKDQLPLIKKIGSEITARFGITPSCVLPIPRERFPKTTSGKIQRGLLKQTLENGGFDELVREVDILAANPLTTLPAWFYKKIWTRKELHRRTELTAGSVLVVLGNDDTFFHELKKLYPDVLLVQYGESFTHLRPDCYIIKHESREDYSTVLSEIREAYTGKHIQFIHTRNVGDEAAVLLNPEDVYGVIGISALVGAIDVLGLGNVSLWLLSNHLQFVLEGDEVISFRATIHGFLKSVAAENPGMFCAHIDYDTLNPDTLLYEIANNKSDTTVAYRQGDRFVSRIQQVDFETDRLESIILKNGGFYIISGGLGAIGLEVGGLLVARYNAKILLVGRSDESTLPLEKQRSLQRLQKIGAHVMYGAVDIADGESLKALIRSTEEKWQQQIDGAFHLAGEIGGSMKDHWANVEKHLVRNVSKASFDEVFRTKVWGTLNLYESIKHNPEAIFVSFSSVNSYFGGYSFCAYSSACSFLDYFTMGINRRDNRSAVVINWSMWENMGMNADNPFKDATLAKGFLEIGPEDGLKSMLTAFHQGDAQILIGLDGGNQNIRKATPLDVSVRKALTMFYSEDGSREVNGGEVIEKLAHAAKDFPVYIEKLSEFQRKNNGDIDLSALYQFTALHSVSTHIEATSDNEKRIAKIWEGVLGRKRISVLDKFFELGGDSLKATQILLKIYEEFNVLLGLNQIFENPTIKALSDLVVDSSRVEFENIERVQEQQHYELSHAQRRIWLGSQLEEASVGYNIHMAYPMDERPDINAITAAFRILVDRYEILRTVFPVVSGEVVQKVLASDEVQVRFLESDVRGSEEQQTVINEIGIQEASEVFDLTQYPLFRVRIVQTADERSIIFFTIHHIICDGWSLRILFNELVLLYQGFKTNTPVDNGPVSIQYKDYSAWHNNLLHDGRAEKSKLYWQNKLEGVSLVNIVTDGERTNSGVAQAGRIDFYIDADLAVALDATAAANNTSLYTVMVSLLKILLFKYTRQSDLTIGSPVSGRIHPELESQLGLFMNMVLVRDTLQEYDTFEMVLSKVKKTVVEALENEFYPFDLVHQMIANAGGLRGALFNVGFTLQNQFEQVAMDDLSRDGQSLPDYDYAGTALSDLWFLAYRNQDTLSLSIVFNRELFQEASIVLLAEQFKQIISNVVRNPELPIRQVKLGEKSDKKVTVNLNI